MAGKILHDFFNMNRAILLWLYNILDPKVHMYASVCKSESGIELCCDNGTLSLPSSAADCASTAKNKLGNRGPPNFEYEVWLRAAEKSAAPAAAAAPAEACTCQRPFEI